LKRYILLFLVLLTGLAFSAPTLTPTVKSLPSVTGGVYISVGRQQAVCLSTANNLVIRWDDNSSANKDRIWHTHDAGDNWTEMTLATADTIMSAATDYFSVWDDTTYVGTGTSLSYPHGWDFATINPNGTLYDATRFIDSTAFSVDDRSVFFSNQPASFGNEMVALARTSSAGIYWFHSPDRGRSWANLGTYLDRVSGATFGTNTSATISLTWNPPDTVIALHQVGYDVNVYYYKPHDTTWVRHGSTRFNAVDLTSATDGARCFSGIIVNDTTYVLGTGSTTARNVYRVWSSHAYGTATPTQITLDSVDATLATGFTSYCALQEIKSLNAVMAYFRAADSTVYCRMLYNGTWTDKVQLSTNKITNLTAPFQVPTSHGDRGYVFFNNGLAAGSNGYAIVVDITVGGATPKGKRRKLMQLGETDTTDSISTLYRFAQEHEL
jgi:hypothetical protein